MPAVMTVDAFFLVFEYLSVELVGEFVNRSIQVCAIGIGEDFRTAYVDCGFGSLFEFVHAQNDVGVGDVVVVSFQLLQLLSYVTLESVGNFDVMSGYVQLHSHPPLSASEWLTGE